MNDTLIKETRKKEILEIVDKILQQSNFNGKSVDVVDLASRQGFLVFSLKDESRFDGVIIRSKNNEESSNIIAYKKKLSEKQNRFIIAHELGHYFLHFNNEILNKNGIFAYAYHSDSNFDKKLESEADFFAANLLLPKEAFVNEAKSLGELVHYEVGLSALSDTFNVTIDCIKKRLVETNAL